MTLPQEVVAAAQAVNTEVEQAAKTIEGEVKAVAEEVKAEVAKALIEISTEEKLALRTVENDFLKTRMEIDRLEKKAADLQRQFPQMLDTLTKKYVEQPAEFVFDTVKLAFVRRSVQQAPALALAPAPKQ